MFRYDFEHSLISWICSASQAPEKALNEEMAPHGITCRQWQVLGRLVLEGTLSQAERMRIVPLTLAGIVKRMDRAGRLGRSPCPDDRQRKMLGPTDRIGPVWETIASAARRVRSRAAEGLSEADPGPLLADLDRIRDNVATPALAEELHR